MQNNVYKQHNGAKEREREREREGGGEEVSDFKLTSGNYLLHMHS